ncbi:hypothetical protein SS50377_23772 [Spironucleus salmonicida]|uniref:PCI domain-containing protein n=1 Tax=Spironucleus salmonicida TaxID=348837 RepID=V6LPB3_9EUKA|nr:hypothetical protein SS50377_23772 [Spironucleus salmonicida]|eukprot:EST46450.1 Hypothetical protein SS50377_13534 [Spironucleus salmonicida]
MLKQQKDQLIEDSAVEDIKQHKSLPISEQISYYTDMERVYRLRADTISAPIYALSLLETIEQPQQRLITAQSLFKARSQFPSTQEKISEFLLQFLNNDLQLLTLFTQMTRSSINVEKYFLVAEIKRIQLLEPQEAANAAEKISSESALQVDFSTRLEYLYTQFQLVEAIKDPVRVLLIAQKYNAKAFENYLKSDSSAELKLKSHEFRSKILLIIARAHISQKRWFSASNLLFESAISMIECSLKGVENVFEIALICGFISGNAEKIVESGYFTIGKDVAKRIIHDNMNDNCKKIAEIVLKKEIQHYQILQNLDFSFLQNKEMESQIVFGFVKLQFDKIYKVFTRITLQKLSQMIGVDSVEIEKVLIQNDYLISIDRVTGIIDIGVKNKDLDYKTMGQSVQEILWNVAEISYLLWEK